MQRHNCCINTKAIIDYIASRQGPVHELLVGLEDELKGISAPLSFLSDPHNWVSSEVCRLMYANARRITGEEDAAYHIGFDSVIHNRLGYILEILVRAIVTPRAAVRRIKALNDKFNRNKKVELVEIKKDSALVRLHWDPKLNLNQDFCRMNRGIYAAMFTVWGLPPGQVVETQCQFSGAPYCEFQLSWVNPSFWGRLKGVFLERRRLLARSLAEIERDKRLLENKFWEIQGLNRRLQEKVDHLWSIHEAGRVILSEFDLGKLLPEVLRIFLKEIGYSRGMIMLLDEQGEVLRFVEVVGVSQREKEAMARYEIPLTRKSNILVRVALTGQPVVAPDVSALKLNQENVLIKNFKPQSLVILPLLSRGRVIGVLAADRGSRGQAGPNLDHDFLQGFANQVALAIENARMYQEQRNRYLVSIQALVEALEAKDPYTRGHSERVTHYAVHLAEEIGLPAHKVEQLRNMCLVHDIGKIGVERSILNKKDALSEAEINTIRYHPIIGHKIIDPLKLSPEEVAIVRRHHERYDGQGYPDGLAGEDIPIQVRVVSVCDSFDAMTSDRPYRHALSVNEALFRLRGAAGTQLDPQLVRTFEKLVRSGRFNDVLGSNEAARVA
ncbi:MAG: HD domain-containing phosphohydrolase [Pseudomonadota bacterium]